MSCKHAASYFNYRLRTDWLTHDMMFSHLPRLPPHQTLNDFQCKSFRKAENFPRMKHPHRCQSAAKSWEVGCWMKVCQVLNRLCCKTRGSRTYVQHNDGILWETWTKAWNWVWLESGGWIRRYDCHDRLKARRNETKYHMSNYMTQPESKWHRCSHNCYSPRDYRKTTTLLSEEVKRQRLSIVFPL